MALFTAGVDIGAHSVKLVVGRARMRRLEVVERREVLLERDEAGVPVEGAVRRALEQVTAGLQPWPQVVHAVMPADAVLVRSLEIPRAAARRADAVILREIEDDLPIAIEDAVVDHVELPGHGKSVLESIVAVTPSVRVRELLDLLESVRLDPAGVGVGGSIYAELGRAAPGLAAAGCAMVIDMGARRTDIAIFESGQFAGMRTISIGGDDVTRAIGARFGAAFAACEDHKIVHGSIVASRLAGQAAPAAPAQAAEQVDRSTSVLQSTIGEAVGKLVPQIRQTIVAHASKHGRRIERAYLCGGASLLTGVCETLAASLGIEVIHLGALLGDPSPDGARFCCATALAWRALGQGADARLDLRKGPFVFKGEALATRKRMARVAIAALVLVLGWSFYAIARISSLEAREQAQQERLAELTEKYLGEEITDFDLAERMLQSAKPQKNPMPDLDAFDFIDEMSRLMPVEVVHDIEQLDIKPGKVQIRGIVDTIAARDEIIAQLEQWDDCVTAISKGKTTQSPKDNRQKYTLDLETRCP